MSDEQGAIPEGRKLIDRLTHNIETQRVLIEQTATGSVEREAARLAYATMKDARSALLTPAADRLTDTGEGKPCDFWLGDCRRCGKRADRDNQQEPCIRSNGPFSPLAIPKPPVDAGTVQRYRHKARGTEYDLIGTAELQDASGAKVEEGALLAIYRGEDGKLWARRHTEFGDGRFERIRNLPDAGEPL